MSEDPELLRRYAEEKSEAAFAELVRRHVDLVYVVALRRVGGDTYLAQEVAQGVFTDLARKAAALVRHPALGAWLFRSARFAAAQAMRAEKRRAVREQEAHLMHEITHGPAAFEPNWRELRPVLDDELDALPERDRVAVWLHVCEGRPFAEIGARLSASEDAVRVRVDRALEKMRASLARRGIVSTTAALTSALAHEAGIVVPAGLAASVTGAALAGAATGSGLAAELGLSIFMSTTKLATWSAAVAMLCASLVGNAYLLSTPAHQNEAVSGNPAMSSLSGASAPTAAPAMPFTLVASANLPALRDQLRTSGADETTIRTMLEGILWRRYREKLSEDRAERARRGWWRDPRLNMTNPESPIQFTDDQRLLREMVTLPLEQLLGPDPLVVAEVDARYAFLPAELRQAFGRLDREVPPSFIPSGEIATDGVIEAELARQRRTVEEKRNELLDTLTPAQRLDWEMRMSQFATNLGRQLEPIGATEAEYRAVFPIADQHARARDVKYPDLTDVSAARDEAEQQAMQQLVTTFGYERALDFIWSRAIEYAPYARVARDANLPGSTAGRVMQLAAETAQQAAAVHHDTALSVDQKRAALLALQQDVQPALDALLPPAVQQRLAPNAQTWLTGLATGSYKSIRGSLPGASGLVMTFPQSVDNPPRGSVPRSQPLPQRPPTP